MDSSIEETISDDSALAKRRKLNSSTKEETLEDLQECEDFDPEEESEDEEQPAASDNFTSHFGYELPENQPNDKIQYKEPVRCEYDEIGPMLQFKTHLGSSREEAPLGHKAISELGLKKNVADGAGELTPFQINFLELLLRYGDISYMHRTYRRGEALRKVWVLHMLNHILVSRARIVRNNSRLSKNPDLEFRDQGFTRPQCVVLAPFRHDCHRIVHSIIDILGEVCTVSNRKRFDREFGPPPVVKRKMKKKPLDYEQTFEGNIEEDFKIGLSIKNRSVTLYSDFYRSDLVLASPLALRQVLTREGDNRDGSCDFLSSVEVLIVERAEVLMLQNIVHLMHVLKRFNLLPRQSRGCDFSRVRTYACDGLSRLYRQTVVLSSVGHRWFDGVVHREFCSNHQGYAVSLARPKTIATGHVLVTQRMVFRIFEFSDPAKEFDARFSFFVDKVLPDFSLPDMAQTLIFVPSYFDFVRLRNHFRESETSATMICEYSSPGKVAEARNNFFKGRRHFMLYTERAHFYNRYRLKGIQHLLFYQPPLLPSSFRDLQASLLDGVPRRAHEPRTCTLLASALDHIHLEGIKGINLLKEGAHVMQLLR